MRYQETWIKGKSTGDPHQRECAKRYSPISSFLDQYERPFSVFDLGANLGYFSIRIAEDFPESVCIMADSRPELVGILEQNDLPNTLWMNARISAQGLHRLGECESIDLVLALSVLHHFGNDWKYALVGLRKLGEWVIAELPAEDDTGSLNGHLGGEMKAYMLDEGAELIGSFPSHKSGKPRPMYLLPGKNSGITRQSIDSETRGAPKLKGVEIESDFTHKSVTIHHGDSTSMIETRPFIPGINLWNFIKGRGVYPSNIEMMVTDEILAMNEINEWHDDLRPWNFIIDGNKVHAIDSNTKAWRESPESGGLDKCLDLMRGTS